MVFNIKVELLILWTKNKTYGLPIVLMPLTVSKTKYLIAKQQSEPNFLTLKIIKLIKK